MSVLNGTKVVKSKKYPDHFFQITGSEESALNRKNVGEDRNDHQMQAILSKYDITKYFIE